jgi:hypothetical protein
MSQNEHTFYYGQSLPHILREGTGQQLGSNGGTPGTVRGDDTGHTEDVRETRTNQTVPLVPTDGPMGPGPTT